MLRHLGQAGVEPLLELCRHRHAEARAQAVNSLRLQFDRCGDSRLIAELLQMLVDPSSSVTYNAVGLVKGLPRKMLSLAPAGLVEALLARCRAEPLAGTFSEVEGGRPVFALQFAPGGAIPIWGTALELQHGSLLTVVNRLI